VQALRADVEGAIEGRSASVGIVDLGSGPEQVATLTADLGAALAASGRNVLVIDANFEHTPRMPEFVFGTSKLADVLTHPFEDQEELLSFIKRTVNDQPEVLPGLRVFASGTMEGDAIDVLAGRQLTVLLKEVGPVFDAVLVAMPGFEDPAADTLSQRLDYLLPVARAGRSTIDSLQQVEKHLRARRSSLLGGVLLVGRPVRSPRRKRAPSRHARGGDRASPARPPSPGGESVDPSTDAERQQGRTTVHEPDDTPVEVVEPTVRPAPSHGLTRKAAKTVFAAADAGKGVFPGPRLLIYHQIGATLGREMEVDASTFRQQLDWLASHGDVVALEEALLRVKEADSHRLFVLTFDDGYEDMYRHAFPLLTERGLPFTLYLTTDPVERQALITPGALASPLSWEQVGEMLDSGLMTLGSHTHHHVDLRDLEPGRIVDELDTADRLIYQRTGIKVQHFAYPKGYWSEVAEPFVRERYVTAVLGAGEPVTDTTDPHRIHRIPIQKSDGMAFFRRKMKSGMRMEESVRRRLRGYEGVAPE
jgi:peptidoglycan/xylan/chitin deacetylase (PgdA/CDA1 family)/Mrp family chromosome partitioning ATPase